MVHRLHKLFHTLFSAPYGFLLSGILCFSIGAIATHSGRIWIRFHGWAYRAEEPKTYWWNVASYCLIGAGFIAYFMYLGTTVGYPPLW